MSGFALDLFTIHSYIGEANARSADSLFKDRLPGEEQRESPDESFLLATADTIIHFSLHEGQFYPSENKLKDSDINSQLSCCYAMRINLHNPSMKAFATEEEKIDVVLTGHKNGLVYAWENDELSREICRYKAEILCITSFDLGVLIVTDSSNLYIVTLQPE